MIQALLQSRLLHDAKLESGFAVDLTTPIFLPFVGALPVQFSQAEAVKGLTATGPSYFDSDPVFVEQRSERRGGAQSFLFDETDATRTLHAPMARTNRCEGNLRGKISVLDLDRRSL
jgi:hypothetical protein